MGAQEMPITHEPNRSDKQEKIKNDKFTKWQSFLLIFGTLLVCIVGGYFVSDKYLWANADEERINEQLDYYKGKVDAEPNDAENRVNLGYTYFVKGDNSDAIKQLKMAVELDKEYFGAYFNLGLVYLDDERYNDALKQAQKAVDLAPRNFKSHLLAGMTYRELKMYKEADKSLKEALKIAPTNCDVITEIGKVAEDQGKYKEAEKFFKEALSFDPLYKAASEGLERIDGKTKDKDSK
ncbi:tetratricopeptide repeat protein [Bacillus sp. DNRA2]|nr:tetratricopeptide repeat protein [Bacillus sp. DNRA2]